MMTILLACAIGLVAPAASSTIQNNHEHVAASTGDAPVKRGAAIGSSPLVSLDSIISNPDAYADKSLIIEGQVGAVCTNKGCWMEIAAGKGKKGVRVTFKDYGFFVPINSQGMKVKAEGEVKVHVLSKEDVDHYVGEGASIDAREDGTALEVTFIATGVELRKK